ncbi:hypothetical protein REPUB_Repub17cG0153400 [Reevesia pubescens]
MTLKNKALREKAFIQQKLNSKSEELEQRNMALAKELVVLKLVSDLDLEQEEILKLASLGNEANSQDTIDNLIRSLASHKKSYKELMAKCNLLERGEARLLKKLEKAKTKIDKLKSRIQEPETSIEVKDNEALKALKASKKIDDQGFILKVYDNSHSSIAKNSSKKHQMQYSVLPLNNMDLSRRLPKDSPCLVKENIHFDSPIVADHSREALSTVVLDE